MTFRFMKDTKLEPWRSGCPVWMATSSIVALFYAPSRRSAWRESLIHDTAARST
jgi:hypothetical protein